MPFKDRSYSEHTDLGFMISPSSISMKETKRLKNNCIVKFRRDSLLSDKKKEMLFEVVKC
jgi:hypothetical protein